MIDTDEFKEILAELEVSVPEESLAVFRDIVVGQGDSIVDAWIQEKMNNHNE